mgnify:CR=1 FL=1
MAAEHLDVMHIGVVSGLYGSPPVNYPIRASVDRSGWNRGRLGAELARALARVQLVVMSGGRGRLLVAFSEWAALGTLLANGIRRDAGNFSSVDTPKGVPHQ